MKAIYIKKTDLNKSLEDFLRKVGAVRGDMSYPGYVHMAKEDADVLRRNNRRKIRAELPYAEKRKIDAEIGMYWLQYGPNSSLGHAVRPGRVLVDVEGIDAAEAAEEQRRQYEEQRIAAEIAEQERQRDHFEENSDNSLLARAWRKFFSLLNKNG